MLVPNMAMFGLPAAPAIAWGWNCMPTTSRLCCCAMEQEYIEVHENRKYNFCHEPQVKTKSAREMCGVGKRTTMGTRRPRNHVVAFSATGMPGKQRPT